MELHHPSPADDVPDANDRWEQDWDDVPLRRSTRRPSRRAGSTATRRAARAELEGSDPRREPGPSTADPSTADPSTAGPSTTSVPIESSEPNWSSWLGAQHGPTPHPPWLVTDLGAIDTELGVLKSGKEATVHLLERAVPDGASCLLAAKRYRTSQHRMFHRDAGYIEGRRVRRSRETRAMARRTDFGRELLAGQWAAAEFDALSRLWQLGRNVGGIRVPYPAQWSETELLLEFIGEPDGQAAPRLAEQRPDADQLADWWQQLLDALGVLAAAGLAHADLSPYNVLVHRGELVLIDLPQVVDLVANPQGPEFLARDVAVSCRWFVGRGLPDRMADPEQLTARLLADAGVY
jgi:RIO kinase 1